MSKVTKTTAANTTTSKKKVTKKKATRRTTKTAAASTAADVVASSAGTSVNNQADSVTASTIDSTPKSTESDSAEKKPTRVVNTVSNQKSNASSTASSPSSKPASKSGSALAVIALLISLLALAGVAYTWYDTQVKQVNAASRLVTDVAEVGSQVAILGDRVESLRGDAKDLVSATQLELRVGQLQEQTRERLTQVSASQDDVIERMSALQDSLSQGTTDFVLDDVAQLLKSANVSVLVLGNRDGAINALQIAEQQLQDLADPRFTSVRQKVLSDIAALEAVEQVDMEKLSVSIQSLVADIDSLDLFNEPEESSQDVLSLASTESQAVAGFSEGLREMGRDFLSLFTIKVQRVDQPPTPLLAPEQRYFLNLNLSLALNKAQLAALQGRPQIFQQSIAEARQWVIAYFDVETPKVKTFLEGLAELEQTQLDVELPSVAQGYAEFIAVRGQR
jgi:uroporphyrin-3 C-methyltransferase